MKIPVEVQLSDAAVSLLKALRNGIAGSLLHPDPVYTELCIAGLSYRLHAGPVLSPIGEQVADFYLSLPF